MVPLQGPLVPFALKTYSVQPTVDLSWSVAACRRLAPGRRPGLSPDAWAAETPTISGAGGEDMP